MTLGEKIQKLRKEMGMSQEQLAATLDVSRQAVSKWENGESLPDISKVVLLSECFQVTTDYLLKDEMDKQQINKANTENLSKDGTAVIISSALVVIGFIVSWAMWTKDGTRLMYLPFHLTAPGIIIQIAGIVLFEVYNSKLDNKTRVKRRCMFYRVSIWFLAILPSIAVAGIVGSYFIISYDELKFIKWVLEFYMTICCLVVLLCSFTAKRLSR